MPFGSQHLLLDNHPDVTLELSELDLDVFKLVQAKHKTTIRYYYKVISKGAHTLPLLGPPPPPKPPKPPGPTNLERNYGDQVEDIVLDIDENDTRRFGTRKRKAVANFYQLQEDEMADAEGNSPARKKSTTRKAAKTTNPIQVIENPTTVDILRNEVKVIIDNASVDSIFGGAQTKESMLSHLPSLTTVDQFTHQLLIFEVRRLYDDRYRPGSSDCEILIICVYLQMRMCVHS